VDAAAGSRRVPRAPIAALRAGLRRRNEIRTHATLLCHLERRVSYGWRVVDEIRFLQPLLRIWSWPGRYRLRRPCLLARHVALYHRGFHDGPDGLARGAIERVDPSLLRGRRQRFATRAVHRDVEE